MGYTPITSNSFEKDIELIVGGEYMNTKALTYEVIVSTEYLDIPLLLLESIETMCDYVNNITDYILVNFKMSLGDYVYDVLPNEANMEATVKLKWYNKTISTRYKCVITKGLHGVKSGTYENIPRSVLNERELVNIELQLLDRVVEVLRTTTNDGIYNYKDVKDVIRISVTEKLKEITIEGVPVVYDNPEGDYRINIHEPDNITKYRHIEIPFGTNVFDIPSYLQDTSYGVYDEDIGTYQHTINYTKIINKRIKPIRCFYTYPIFNNTNYDTSDSQRLLIMSHPTDKYRHSEHTFTEDGDLIKIVASGTPKNFYTGDNDNADKGNVIVSTDPKFVTGTNNNITDDSVSNIPKSNIQARVKSDRVDGVNNYRYVDTPSNMHKHRSGVNKQQFTMYQVQWNFSNPKLLYPGMPVALLYKHADYGLIMIKGTLVVAYSKYDAINKMNTTMLNMMMEKPK